MNCRPDWRGGSLAALALILLLAVASHWDDAPTNPAPVFPHARCNGTGTHPKGTP